MEIIKDYIRASTIEAPVIQRKTVEYECIIPDNMPDALSVSSVDAIADVENIRTENTFTVADMNIKYNIIYLSDADEKPVKAFSSKNVHTLTADIEEINKDSFHNGNVIVENIEHTLTNSRKVTIRANLRLEIYTENNTQTGLPVDITGSETIRTLAEKTNICTCTEDMRSTCDINSNIELPGIKKPFERLLYTSASLCDLNYITNGAEVQIRGNLSLCTLYISEEDTNALQIIENQIPFTHSVNVDYRDDQQFRLVRPIIKSCDVQIIEDSDGLRRVLNVNARVEFNIKTYTCIEFNLIEDAFCLEKNVNIIKENVKLIESMQEVRSSFAMKEIISRPENLASFKEIVNVSCCPGETHASCNDDEITIKGEIVCNILYLTDDITTPVASFSTKLEFTQSVEQRGISQQDIVTIYPEINHTSTGIISDSEAELRLSVTIYGISGKSTEKSFISEFDENDCNEDNVIQNIAPILLYIVQPGDSIWKISKKYKTDPEYLKKINRLPEPYIIYPGQKLIISK